MAKEVSYSQESFGKKIRPVIVTIFVLLIFLTFPFSVTGHGHSHDHHDNPAFKYSKEANLNVKATDNIEKEIPSLPKDLQSLWLEALGSTILISLAPFLILFLVPLNDHSGRESTLKILLSFASGGLLGDAFLHLIPHALSAYSHTESGHSGHSHGHSHGGHEHDHGPHSKVGFWVLMGILLFLFVEKFVRLIKPEHSHSHSEKVDNSKRKKKKDHKKDDDAEEDTSGEETSIASSSTSQDQIKISGYLNMAADFTHNFTDGLAIGASYLAGRGVGLVTTVTILLHEVPHEIGDFAILVQSGCSKKKAMYLQLVTALGAISGTIVSLMAEGLDEAAVSWILPLTAGGFIYIATVSILPELLSDTKLGQSVKEVAALLSGVGLMVLIANYE